VLGAAVRAHGEQRVIADVERRATAPARRRAALCRWRAGLERGEQPHAAARATVCVDSEHARQEDHHEQRAERCGEHHPWRDGIDPGREPVLEPEPERDRDQPDRDPETDHEQEHRQVEHPGGDLGDAGCRAVEPRQDRFGFGARGRRGEAPRAHLAIVGRHLVDRVAERALRRRVVAKRNRRGALTAREGRECWLRSLLHGPDTASLPPARSGTLSRVARTRSRSASVLIGWASGRCCQVTSSLTDTSWARQREGGRAPRSWSSCRDRAGRTSSRPSTRRSRRRAARMSPRPAHASRSR
jgi:hypothetical protein